MGKSIDEVVTKLFDIISADVVDWGAFDDVLLSVEDINVYDDYFEETILSSFLLDGEFYNRGHLMSEVIRRFISCGYDVLANDGKHGGLALSNLCWTSYDKNILDAAKVLMGAGAPVIYRSDDDDIDDELPRGLLRTIGWKVSGAWGPDKDYNFANVLEAYYQMAEVNINGNDYGLIECYSECIGKKVMSAFLSCNDEKGTSKKHDDLTSFESSLVIFFDDKPLVISPYIYFVVNPLYVEDNKSELVDVSLAFSDIIGSTLEEIEYFDATICRLVFSNGYQMILASRDVGYRKRIGTYKIIPIENTPSIEDIEINCICGSDNLTFSNTITFYNEECVALFGKNKAYLMHLALNDEQSTYLKLFPCPKEMLAEYTRKYPVGEPKDVACFYEGGLPRAIRFDYEDDFLYFDIRWNDIEVRLCEYKFNPLKVTSLRDDEYWHIEFSQRQD